MQLQHSLRAYSLGPVEQEVISDSPNLELENVVGWDYTVGIPLRLDELVVQVVRSYF